MARGAGCEEVVTPAGFDSPITGVPVLPPPRRLGQPLWDTNTPFEVTEKIAAPQGWARPGLACDPAPSGLPRRPRAARAAARARLQSSDVSDQPMADENLRRAEVVARRSDLMLAVTTKLSVYPIAGVVPLAKEAGARVVIVPRIVGAEG